MLNVLLVLVFFILVLVLAVLGGWNPAVALARHSLVLLAEIVALAVGDLALSPLAQGACAGAQASFDGGLALHPVREGVLAVLDDRLGGLVAVVGGARFTGGHGGVVDELEEVLAEAGDDGHLLAVFAEGVELVGEGCLEFLAGDIGELGFGDEGLGFGADEFLFEDDDARAVRVFVFELGDLVGDFLFAVARGLDAGFDVADGFDGYAVLVVAVDKLVF